MDTDTPEFNQQIMEHFLNPRNIGEIENADGYAKVGDPNCGDFIEVWIRIGNEIIQDFKFKVFGCWGAIATTSVVSELAIGKSVNDALNLTDDNVIQALKGIPENKQHCSMLGIQGLRGAIAAYFLKENYLKYAARIEKYRSRGYDIPEMRNRMVQMLSNLPADAKILDIGCGKGHLSFAIARSGRKCIAVDISDADMTAAGLNAIYFNLDKLIEFQIQDAQHLQFEANSFEAVMAAAFFHHVEDPEPVLKEMLRVCHTGGRMVICDFNEKGFQLIAQIHHEENRGIHPVHGWSIEQIISWFEAQGYQPSIQEEEFETIIIVNV
ncbi:iron-sulfur cluster assembly scaffold protein [candidate division KSB1 bacterium]|nr:iron-sulfur cluster assembly scaffold protein [candidate division KSB1 bacterium]